MAGYRTIIKFRELETRLDELGFMPCHPAHHYYENDLVAIKPKDQDSLPIYSRDAEMFIGTIDELEVWLKGVEWARDYDRMLFGKNHAAKRERKEQDYRNEMLVMMLKSEDKKEKA